MCTATTRNDAVGVESECESGGSHFWWKCANDSKSNQDLYGIFLSRYYLPLETQFSWPTFSLVEVGNKSITVTKFISFKKKLLSIGET